MYKENKSFFYLLIGQFLSVLGERISTLVFFSIAVTIISSDSSFLASALIAVQFIPLFIFGYFFGLLADAFNQKHLMLISDLARAFFVFILFLNPGSLLLLYVVVFLIGLFSAMFEPSKKSLIPFIIEKKQLIRLNKIFAVIEIFAIFLGLVLGSILLQYFTVKQSLMINVISYLISFFMILIIKYDYKKQLVKIKSSIFKELKGGLTYLKQNKNPRHVITNITLVNFLSAGFIYATISDYTIRNAKGLNPGTEMGIFLITIALGASLTPLFNKVITHDIIKDSKLISLLFLVGGLGSVVLGLSMLFFNVYVGFIFLFFLITGIFVGLIYVRILYLLHTHTNEKYYGRVISVNDFISSITTVIGVLLGGIIVEYLTYSIGFILSGIIFIFGFIYFILIRKNILW